MRGIYTSVNDIRKRVFSEVAKLSYEYKDGDLSQMDEIPYRVIPGEVSVYRDSVFLERAIVRERMRLAMGLNLRTFSEHAPVTEGASECMHLTVVVKEIMNHWMNIITKTKLKMFMNLFLSLDLKNLLTMVGAMVELSVSSLK